MPTGAWQERRGGRQPGWKSWVLRSKLPGSLPALQCTPLTFSPPRGLPSAASSSSSLALPFSGRSQLDPSGFVLLLEALRHLGAAGAPIAGVFRAEAVFRRACPRPLSPQYARAREHAAPESRRGSAARSQVVGTAEQLRVIEKFTSSFAICMPFISSTCLITLAGASSALLKSGKRRRLTSFPVSGGESVRSVVGKRAAGLWVFRGHLLLVVGVLVWP